MFPSFNDLAKLRYDYIKSMDRLNTIRREPNAIAPSIWTMYRWEDGNQNDLIALHYNNATIWGMFLKQRMEAEFFFGT